MSDSLIARLRAATTPRSRRVVSAVALVMAVWVASRQLKGASTREVELHVPLAALSAGGAVRAATVSFRRGDTVLREVSQRWESAPAEMVARVSLPEGPCQAEVTVQRESTVLTRACAVEVRPDEVLRLPAPTAP